jgi:hypothetical protein
VSTISPSHPNSDALRRRLPYHGVVSTSGKLSQQEGVSCGEAVCPSPSTRT